MTLFSEERSGLHMSASELEIGELRPSTSGEERPPMKHFDESCHVAGHKQSYAIFANWRFKDVTRCQSVRLVLSVYVCIR